MDGLEGRRRHSDVAALSLVCTGGMCATQASPRIAGQPGARLSRREVTVESLRDVMVQFGGRNRPAR